MKEPGMDPSPWWYRRRGVVLTAIYGLGFLAGSLSLDGHEQHPVFVAWGQRFASGHGGAILLWAAVASSLAAWLWRASGTAYLRRAVVFAADVQSDRLIIAGPFRYVRNPLYVGNMFLALAAGVLVTPLGFFIIVGGNAVLVGLLAAEESRQMAARYGAAYEAFRAAVPAFFPRLRPAAIPGGVPVRPSWGPALLGDAFCLAFAVAIVPIALFGNGGVAAFWAIWVPSLLLFIVLGWRASREKPSTGT